MTKTGSTQPAATAPAPPSSPPGAGGTGSTVMRNSMWLTVDTVAGMVTAFYCSILVGRRLGPDFMGQYNFVLYFATALKMVMDLAIPVTVRRFSADFIGRGDYGAVRALVHRAIWVQAQLSAIGVAAGLAIVLSTFTADQRLIGALAVVSIVPNLLLGTPGGALWAAGRLRENVISSLGANLVNFAGTTVSVLAGWGLIGLVVSLLLSRLFDFVVRYHLFKRVYAQLAGPARADPFDPSLRRRMVHFAAQQMVLALLYTLLFDRIEVFFLRGMSASREIAFFSISFTLVSYLLQFPRNLVDSASVHVWVKHGRSPGESARMTGVATWTAMLFAAPVLFGAAAVSDPLLRVLYGTKYLPAAPVLSLLAVVSLSLAVAQPAQNLLVGAGRNGVYIAWLCVAGAVGVVANLALVPGHGAIGAALGKGLALATAAVGFLAYARARLQVRLPFQRMARLLVACAVMAVVVRLVGRPLPALPALLVGVPLGAGLFFLLARGLRLLDAADGDRLRALARMVPGRARAGYLSLLDFLVRA